MTASPVLKIHISPSDKGELFCCLRLTLSDDPEIDAGTLELPFELKLMPAIQKVLNLIQAKSPDKYSQEQPFDQKAEEAELQGLLVDNSGKVYREVHEVVGKKIGKALLKNQEFNNKLQAFYAFAKAHGGDIVLEFDSAALKLAALPWELAYYESEPLLMHLGAKAPLGCTRVVIDPSSDSTEQSSSISQSLRDKVRILAVASYGDMEERDRMLAQNYRQKDTFVKAFEDSKKFKDNKLKFDHIVDFESAEYVTLSSLQNELSTEPHVDILDYYGHGTFDNGNATLRIGNVERPELLPAAKLKLLENWSPLVVLHACNSAQLNIDEELDSLALSLIKAGVQAVVAMQFEIQMVAVLETVVPTFYNALAEGYSLPKAIAEVRHKLYMKAGAVNWFVPVLYMREFTQQPYMVLGQGLRLPANPFVGDGALKNAKLFISRFEEQLMWERLQAKGSFSIIGPAGSGKSTMLNLIREKAKTMFEDPEEVKVVSPIIEEKMDLLGFKRAVYSAFGGRQDISALAGQQDINEKLNFDIQELLRHKHVILALDDLGGLDRGNEGKSLRDWLKGLQSQSSVQLVVAMRQTLEDTFKNDDSEYYSSLHDVIDDEIKLGPFTEEEGLRFISERLTENPLKAEQFKDLFDKSLYPKQLQKACRERYDEYRRHPPKQLWILFS